MKQDIHTGTEMDTLRNSHPYDALDVVFGGAWGVDSQ